MTRILTTRTAAASASILVLALSGATSGVATASAPSTPEASTEHTSAYLNDSIQQPVKTPSAAAKASYFASAGKVVIYYNASRAASFSSQINQTAQIWNSALNNVEMRTGGSDITYNEGYFAEGSTARWSTPGHGSINIDFRQTQEFNSLRVVSHETGHVLGNMPDNYTGPCSELMSGGGAGPSCTNAVPNANERMRADSNY